MDLSNMTPEQVERARACKDAAELAEFAKSEGIELTDEQLAAVSGGVVKGWDEPPNCMYCGSDNTEFTGHGVKCHNCGKEFSGLLG